MSEEAKFYWLRTERKLQITKMARECVVELLCFILTSNSRKISQKKRRDSWKNLPMQYVKSKFNRKTNVQDLLAAWLVGQADLQEQRAD